MAPVPHDSLTDRELLLLLNERQERMQQDFEQLRNIVYGIIAIPLTGFMAALVFLVWRSAQ